MTIRHNICITLTMALALACMPCRAQTFTPTSPTYFSDGNQDETAVPAGGSVTAYFECFATGAYNGQPMDIVVGLVDPHTGLWVGGIPQIILFFGASPQGLSTTGAFNSLSVPWRGGSNFVWFEAFVDQIPVTPTIDEFETNPPIESGYLTGILGTVIGQPPPQPGISNVAVVGTNIVISGTNCVAGEPYRLLTTIDIALPISQWTPVQTNTFQGSSFIITNTVDNKPQEFYMISVP